MNRLREIQVNPIVVIVIALVVVAGLAYAFWLRPASDEARIKAEWTSEEAASKRGPGRQVSEAHQRKLQELLAKENVRRNLRSRDRE